MAQQLREHGPRRGSLFPCLPLPPTSSPGRGDLSAVDPQSPSLSPRPQLRRACARAPCRSSTGRGRRTREGKRKGEEGKEKKKEKKREPSPPVAQASRTVSPSPAQQDSAHFGFFSGERHLSISRSSISSEPQLRLRRFKLLNSYLDQTFPVV